MSTDLKLSPIREYQLLSLAFIRVTDLQCLLLVVDFIQILIEAATKTEELKAIMISLKISKGKTIALSVVAH